MRVLIGGVHDAGIQIYVGGIREGDIALDWFDLIRGVSYQINGSPDVSCCLFYSCKINPGVGFECFGKLTA